MNATPDPGGAPDPRARSRRRRAAYLALILALVLPGGLLLRDRMTPRAPAAPEVSVAPAGAVAPDTVAASPRIVAYYFHTTYRCASCRKIEDYAHRAIETGFAQAVADGRIVWRVVNVEEPGNEHFVKDYQLFTKSVVLSDERSGREVRWKNLPKVWELLNDEGKFVEYVQTETQAYLDGAP